MSSRIAAPPLVRQEGQGRHPEAHEARAHEAHAHEEGRARRLTTWSRRLPLVKREVAIVLLSGLGTAAGMAGEWLGWPAAVTVGLFLLAILVGAIDIVPKGLRGLLHERSLDINFLVTVAVGGAMLLGQWSEGATVVFLFSLGEALESYTLARTRRSIQALMAAAPETARVLEADGVERTMAVETVPVGATVVVRPGDRIPLDGVVLAGESTVDQAPITGESVPLEKAEGDTVYAGTINGRGYLEVRATKPFAENTLAKIIHLVESAQSEKAPAQRFVERFARVYTPMVVLGAVLLVVVPPLVFGQPLVPWFNRALVLLLVACPCALVISTPVSVVAAIGNASRHGVLIKGGAYLERAGTLRAVAFDKTGTLTRGIPEVRRVLPCHGLDARELLRLAAGAELRSEHPLGEAIVRAARQAGIERWPAVEGFKATVGHGIEATVDGVGVTVGKPGWVERVLAGEGLSLAPVRGVLEEVSAAGQTAVVAARRAMPGAPPEVLGVIAIADELRPTAVSTVDALRRTGVQRIVLLSGDNRTTSQAIAHQAGIAPQDVFAELLPQDKVAVIKQLVQQHRHVAMVGDGVNDAPALATATVGIAMGAGGSDTALETADVALVADDLTRLPWVLQLSRRAAATIRFNVAFALLSKAIVLGLAAAGVANLWLAIAADTGASIVVILNGMRLLGKQPLPSEAELAGLRRRYGLQEEDEHACHGHH
ncbi:MAG TPA: heavy metal translocating P-type ATPase [Chloroflexota bacterium]|nr:heavy metal translocating P-type ATPase [Chloroflexota bacterium]